jgi:hypothetical protein
MKIVMASEQPERSKPGVKTVVWTDGSCNANGMHGRGGWAALIEQAGTVLAYFCAFSALGICRRLPPIATTGP